MTVNTVSPAIISRAEFNLNAGQKQTPQLVRMDFGNLVTNGGFDTDIVGWSDGSAAGGAIAWNASGYMDVINTTDVARFNQSAVTFAGASYLFKVSKLGSTIAINAGLTAGAGAGGSEIFAGPPNATDINEIIVSPQNGIFVGGYLSSAGTGTVDNISLYEVDPSDDAPWLRLPYGYSVGRTGWIVRDGVVLHPSDYSEVKNSGQTWIKPLVAPGVSTEFSIWGSPSYAV